MKPIKVEDEEFKRAVYSGESYFQVGDRKFILFEVEQINEPNVYEVVDPEEEQKLLEALKSDNPVLSEEEINRMLNDKI
ncbi:hypothetical protein QFZ28_001025 [Neobacillus niacini]|jgi:hypothetical protein|uniref:hypothetical protein n=1 Tax=Neobacillus niacini TaxID=86668 RepID=UPI0027847A49|nr:hypothetical protein [Neobacillus niacini]MDQ1000625.1 hypothetical protein [Neobacillus niacini]